MKRDENTLSGSLSKVAVIIVNCYSEGYLLKALLMLQSQTFRPYRTIVVDNASYPEKMRGIEAEYPGVEFIRPGKNVGFAAANNRGAREAEGCHWIALLNPDAFPDSTWLENLLLAALQNPQYSFFGSRMLCATDSERLDGTGDVYHTSGMVWRRNHGRSAGKTDLDHCEIFSACAAAALYRREAFLEVGGFDESYFCYSEDVDIGFRLRLFGHKGMYVPNAVVHHIGWATTGRRSDFAVYHGHRNLVWTFVKNMPMPLLWVYLPQHILLNLFSLLWFSLQGQTGVIFRAKFDAMRGMARVWGQRKLIQKNRKVLPAELRKVMCSGLRAAWSRRC